MLAALILAALVLAALAVGLFCGKAIHILDSVAK